MDEFDKVLEALYPNRGLSFNHNVLSGFSTHMRCVSAFSSKGMYVFVFKRATLVCSSIYRSMRRLAPVYAGNGWRPPLPPGAPRDGIAPF